jgi:arginase family enzyme
MAGWGKIRPMDEPRRIHIIGVPMDLGQQRRGVDMGPSVIRYAGLHGALRALGYQVNDLGNVPVPLPERVPLNQTRLATWAASPLPAVSSTTESLRLTCVTRARSSWAATTR